MDLVFENFDYTRRVNDKDARVYIDKRTGFGCCYPSYDLKMYYNYLVLMNYFRDEWVNFGYLDLGMLPLVMLPSFCGNVITKITSTLIELLGVTAYSMPAISFFKKRYDSTVEDVWFFRSDLAELINVDLMYVSTIDIVKELIDQYEHIK